MKDLINRALERIKDPAKRVAAHLADQEDIASALKTANDKADSALMMLQATGHNAGCVCNLCAAARGIKGAVNILRGSNGPDAM